MIFFDYRKTGLNLDEVRRELKSARPRVIQMLQQYNEDVTSWRDFSRSAKRPMNWK